MSKISQHHYKTRDGFTLGALRAICSDLSCDKFAIKVRPSMRYHTAITVTLTTDPQVVSEAFETPLDGHELRVLVDTLLPKLKTEMLYAQMQSITHSN